MTRDLVRCRRSRRARLRALGFAACVFAGCAPRYIAPECQSQVNECVSRCITPSSVAQAQIMEHGADTTPPCEQRCRVACP